MADRRTDARLLSTANLVTLLTAGMATIFASCGKLADMVRPFEHTVVAFSGVCVENVAGKPVAGASVAIMENGNPVVTDSGGIFTLARAPTGPAVLVITREGFAPCTAGVDITLNPRTDTIRLMHAARPPAIDTIRLLGEMTRFFNDEISVVFTASDSSGGIAAATVFTGDTSMPEPMTHRYSPVRAAVTDTFTFAYAYPDTFLFRLVIAGGSGDTTADTIIVGTPRLKRPGISLVRVDEGWFTSGRYGHLDISIDDPDLLMTKVEVDWNDGSPVEKSVEHYEIFWHLFDLDAPEIVPVSITVFENSEIMDDSTISVTVKIEKPPLLDKSLFFYPSQYLEPGDTAIRIGVRVLDIEGGRVKTIKWRVNEGNSLYGKYESREYGDDGILQREIGDIFTTLFSTEGLRYSNDVSVIVFDTCGNSSMRTGTFFVAGKPQ